MKFDCKFKHLDHSDALVAYTLKQFEKLKKFELKPLFVHVTFSMKRHLRVVDIHFKGIDSSFDATGRTDDFQSSVDDAIRKLKHQMEREKGKIQHHKNPQMKRLKRAG